MQATTHKKKYTVRWIEHHAKEIEADSYDEAEIMAMAYPTTRTFCYSEIEGDAD